jgi:hypothetical protein
VLFLRASSQQAPRAAIFSAAAHSHRGDPDRTGYHSLKGFVTMSIRKLMIGPFLMYAVLLTPTRADAQFTATPFSDPATGERYRI